MFHDMKLIMQVKDLLMLSRKLASYWNTEHQDNGIRLVAVVLLYSLKLNPFLIG